MRLNSFLPQYEDVYFDPRFLTVIESHLTYLRSLPDNSFLTVTDLLAYKYEGDFYGLLFELGVPHYLHQIVLRINGYSSSADYKSEMHPIVMPKESAIQLIANTFQTTA
jgi:hypothetical protein